ncbi:MAG TPA: hypothetical protein ACFCUC_01790 [Desulfobacterales bacterium]
MNGSDNQERHSRNRRSGRDRRIQPNRRDGLDRRSGMDRRSRPSSENLETPKSKPSFLLRRAIHTLRRRTPQHPKTPKSDQVPQSTKHALVPRAHPRTECRSAAILESGDSRQQWPAMVIDYSSYGFNVEITAPPPTAPGVILHIANYHAAAPRPENVPRYFCEVRWSRPLPGQDQTDRFAVGLKICSDLNEFTRLFSL